MDNNTLRFLSDFHLSEALKVRRDTAWNFNYGFPFPNWDIKCPVCGAKHYDAGIQIRNWKFHRHSSSTGSEHPERVDVSFKCRSCAGVWTHGVKCPKALYEWVEKTMYHFREVGGIITGRKIPNEVLNAISEEATHLFDQ